MDWETATAAFTLVVIVFYLSRRLSKPKREQRKVGYHREDIHIEANVVPEFKPTWKDTR